MREGLFEVRVVCSLMRESARLLRSRMMTICAEMTSWRFKYEKTAWRNERHTPGGPVPVLQAVCLLYVWAFSSPGKE